jgi:hypothetical protein
VRECKREKKKKERREKCVNWDYEQREGRERKKRRKD